MKQDHFSQNVTGILKKKKFKQSQKRKNAFRKTASSITFNDPVFVFCVCLSIFVYWTTSYFFSFVGVNKLIKQK